MVIKWHTFYGSIHLAKYGADSRSGCSLNFSFYVSGYTPNIFGHWSSGSCESSMSNLGWVLAWCGSDLNSVTEDVGAESNRELSFRYAVISSR